MQLRFRELMLVALLVGLLAASYLFLFKPRSIAKAAALDEIKQGQARLDQLNSLSAGSVGLIGQIDEMKKAVAKFESTLPDEGEMDKVLKEIWRMAEKNNLTTKSVRSLPVVPQAGYSEQPMRVSIEGPWTGFYQFLQAVEALPRITRIKEMTMTQDEQNKGQIKVEFTLSVYFQPDHVASTAGKL